MPATQHSPALQIVGDRIRLAREASNVTQKILAEKLGKSRSAVAQWENGHSSPSISDIALAATILGTSAEHLAFGVGNDRAYPIPLVEFHGSPSKIVQKGSVALDAAMLSDIGSRTAANLKAFVAENGVAGLVSEGDRLVLDTSLSAVDVAEASGVFVVWKDGDPVVAEITESLDDADRCHVRFERVSQSVARSKLTIVGRVVAGTRAFA